MNKTSLKVNGKLHTVDLEPETPLLYVLSDEIGLRGPKFGCGMAQCGSCTVILRGQVLRSTSCTSDTTSKGYGSMYGIAAWQDQVYGFSRTGNLVQISNIDGSACRVHDYSMQMIKFSGAAVTTLAPVIPPPVK